MASPEEHKVFIGLGSNLDQPLRQVHSAIAELQERVEFRVAGVSRLYRSKAIGPGEQGDYINAAACLYTRLSPEACLDVLHSIEQAHNRQRTLRWGPRTLDLDILLYGELVHNTERLSIPHPRLTERNFVLKPLLDIDPVLLLPDGRQISDILHIIGQQNLRVIEDG